MDSQDKLDLVIKAIEEAKGITPKGQDVTVYLSNVLKHGQLRLQELYEILHKLEDDEKIVTLMRFPRYLLKLDLDSHDYTDMLTGEKVNPSKEYFTVKVHRSFNAWFVNYWKLTHQQQKKPNSKIPKQSAYQKIWGWIEANKILSIIGAIAAIATIVGVIIALIK